jgi:hypothetical protein
MSEMRPDQNPGAVAWTPASLNPFEPAVLVIFAANALTLWVALAQDWPIALLLWPYWLQSLVIGWFARRRILALQRFSTARLFFGEREAEATPAVRDQVANFLAIHFGIFHAVYLVFMLAALVFGDVRAQLTWSDAGWVLLLAGAFAFSQWFAYRRDVAEDLRREPNLGSLLILPYPRVLPMHLMIILGAFIGGGSFAVALFIGLKTLADLAMHVIEQRWLRSEHGGLKIPVHIGGS